MEGKRQIESKQTRAERWETIKMRTSGNWVSENRNWLENMIDTYLTEKKLIASTQKVKEDESSGGQK